jgi:V/A-type H+-transporting ATPase subunit I
MIVRMKKISLLLFYRDKNRFLDALQRAGFMHILEREEKDTNCLHQLETEVKETDRVLRELALLRGGAGAGAHGAPAVDLLQVVPAFLNLKHQHETLTAELKSIERDEQHLHPFGAVEPSVIRKLEREHIHIRLCGADSKTFERLVQGGALLVEASRTNTMVYFALIGEALAAEHAVHEMHLPELSLAELALKKAAVKRQIADIDARLASFIRCRGELQKLLSRRQDMLSYQSAGLDFNLFVEGTVLAMHGFFPAAEEERLRRIFSDFTVWAAIEDPALDDSVPVQLKNSAFARLFEPITKLYMLPGYREMDPTPILAPFFTLFVGLCLGDVGYGVLIMLLSAIWFCRGSKQPVRSFAAMGVILGAMTVICGFLLNSCFGEALFAGPGIPRESALFPRGAELCLLSSYKNADGITEFPAMSFSLLLGFIQILVAMTMQVIVRIRQGGFANGLMPISYIMMLFGMLIWGAHSNAFSLNIGEFAVGNWKLGPLLLGLPLAAGQALLLGGMAIVLACNNPGQKIFLRPLLGLWELYNYAAGILGDILSYIRLFALGLCGGLLGSTFNALALGFIKKGDAVEILSPWIICTVLLLVCGHCMNFALAIIGAFVHPIRLTFVEFFKNLGFEWGGKPFIPFLRMSSDDN